MHYKARYNSNALFHLLPSHSQPPLIQAGVRGFKHGKTEDSRGKILTFSPVLVETPSQCDTAPLTQCEPPSPVL